MVRAWCAEHAVRCTDIDVRQGARRSAREEVDAAGDPDLIVTLGGDGTFLRGARLAAVNDALVLGVDLGRVGFLTDTSVSEVRTALDSVREDRIRIDSRMLLTLRASRRLEVPAEMEALLACGRGPLLPPPHSCPMRDRRGLGHRAQRHRAQRHRAGETFLGPADLRRGVCRRSAPGLLLGGRAAGGDPDRLHGLQLRRRRPRHVHARRGARLHAGRPAHGVRPVGRHGPGRARRAAPAGALGPGRSEHRRPGAGRTRSGRLDRCVLPGAACERYGWARWTSTAAFESG